MQNLDSSLAVLEIGSIAVGYQTLSSVLHLEGIRALEATAVGPEHFLILLQGSTSVLDQAISEASRLGEGLKKDLLLDHEIVRSPHKNLLSALYSLTQQPLDEALIVVETQRVSGLISAAEILLGWDDLKVIELKPGRGLQGRGPGFFTGKVQTAKPAAEAARVKLRNSLRDGRIEVVENPSQGFREFFNLSGQ